jgi:hypothetical protein
MSIRAAYLLAEHPYNGRMIDDTTDNNTET